MGQIKCQECPKNTYQPDSGQRGCITCRRIIEGQFAEKTVRTGSSSENQCVLPTGQYSYCYGKSSDCEGECCGYRASSHSWTTCGDKKFDWVSGYNIMDNSNASSKRCWYDGKYP
jgi:hypothetical protein